MRTSRLHSARLHTCPTIYYIYTRTRAHAASTWQHRKHTLIPGHPRVVPIWLSFKHGAFFIEDTDLHGWQKEKQGTPCPRKQHALAPSHSPHPSGYAHAVPTGSCWPHSKQCCSACPPQLRDVAHGQWKIAAALCHAGNGERIADVYALSAAAGCGYRKPPLVCIAQVSLAGWRQKRCRSSWPVLQTHSATKALCGLRHLRRRLAFLDHCVCMRTHVAVRAWRISQRSGQKGDERTREKREQWAERETEKKGDRERETLRAACMVINKFHRLAHEYRNAST